MNAASSSFVSCERTTGLGPEALWVASDLTKT